MLLEGVRRPHVVSTQPLAAAPGPVHLCSKDSKAYWACVILPESGVSQKTSLGTSRASAAVPHCSIL